MSVFQLIKLKDLEALLDSDQSLKDPLFVIFKWELCGVCKVNVPLVETLLSTKFADKVTPVWVDIDAENIWAEDELNPRWSIHLAPTYHLYDRNKKLVFSHQNFLANEVLEDEINKIL